MAVYNGTSGDDVITGTTGDDIIDILASGVDVVHGGEGNDVIQVRSPAQYTVGSATLNGSFGNDSFLLNDDFGGFMFRVFGGSGNDDVLFQSGVNSAADMGSGDDLVRITKGQASATLGTGHDRVQIANNDQGLHLTIEDFKLTGTSSDTIDLSHYLFQFHPTLGNTNPFTAGALRLTQSGADTLIEIEHNGVFRTFLTLKAVTASSLTAAHLGGYDPAGGPLVGVTYIGDDTDEIIAGTPGDDVLDGRGGNDTLSDQIGASVLMYGGDGDDSLDFFRPLQHALNGTVLLNGGAGNDRITGANLSTAYGHHNITLVGEGGDDYISFQSVTSVLAQGGDGNDFFQIGGAGADRIEGGAGVDTVSYAGAASGVTVNLTGFEYQTSGGAGTDTLLAIENITGSSYNDSLTGDTGANVLEGGDGDDVLDGHLGQDTATYTSAASAVTVSLALTGAQNTGGAGADTLIRIENLIGSRYNDTLTGDGANNVLNGGSGDDVLDGGAGEDTVSYATTTGSIGAVTVSLEVSGPQNTGAFGVDTLIGIENLIGSDLGDTLTGNASANRLSGGAGDDTLIGGEGNDDLDGGEGDDVLIGGVGDDQLDGRDGQDTASYAEATGGVRVTLASSSAQSVGGGLGSDTLTRIENLTGSAYNDVLTGNDGNNVLVGGAGDDVLSGGLGDDELYGDSGVNTASYSSATVGVTVILDVVGAQNTGGGGVDTLQNITNLIGSNYADTLTGTAGNNVLTGSNGNDILNGNGGVDTLDGGSGVDTATYISAHSGVKVTLSTAAGAGPGTATGDTLISIENLTGSTYDDTLKGSNVANVLDGGAGHDTLYGEGGNDTISGGDGDDLIDAGSGADVVYGNAGNDTFRPSNMQIGGSRSTYDGGDGIDTFDYEVAASGVGFLFNSAGLLSVLQNDIINVEILMGGSGNDTFGLDYAPLAITAYGREGNDYFSSSGGGHTFYAGAGNDEIMMTGGDRVFAEDGDDRVFASGHTSVPSTGVIDGGAGTDTLRTNIEFTVDLQAGTATAHNVVYAVSGIENVMVASVNHYVSSVYGDGAANVISVNPSFDDGTAGFTFDGRGGNDTLSGTRNADTLIGGDGDDSLEGRLGDDSLDGGAGIDAASYASAAAGVTVSLAITGAQNTGAAGNDTLTRIEGLIGSAYADSLTGDAGANSLSGGNGDDTLTGGAGDDTLDGGAGNDTASYAGAASGVTVAIIAGAQNTVGAGTDTLIAIENLTGSAHNDTLTGNSGVNVLRGGDGDDVLDGGEGADTLDGGAGADTASYASATYGVQVTLSTPHAMGAIGNPVTDTFVSIENLTGSAFADALKGDDGVNILIGGGGNDSLMGEGGNDALYGGVGEDNLFGGLGDDYLDGGDGVDAANYSDLSGGPGVIVDLRISGPQNTIGGGIDTLVSVGSIVGSQSNDILIGDAGNNVINGVNGDDLMMGGAGQDVMRGGAGVDTASYANATSAVTVSLMNTAFQQTGGGGQDLIELVENLIGSDFNDRLTGSDIANVLEGGAGDDTLIALGGDDVLVGGAGVDRLEGGDGNDTARYAGLRSAYEVGLGPDGVFVRDANGVTDILIGVEQLQFSDQTIAAPVPDRHFSTAGDDALTGGAGIDTATYETAPSGVTVSLSVTGAQATGHGSDTLTGIENLTGSAYADTLTGDAGNNVLSGLGGNDVLEGGAGADTLDGGAGSDTASYAQASAGVKVTLIVGGATVLSPGVDPGDTLVSIENLTGSAFADTLAGDHSANVLSGGGGDDFLYGHSGDDTLFGGDGADVLFGSHGADILLGGDGDDFLRGDDGSGADDHLDGGAGVDTASYSTAASGVLVSLAIDTPQDTYGAGVDRLIGVENLQGSSFDDLLSGDAGDNVIDGRDGDDILVGEAGNDTLIGGAGDDVLEGGAGRNDLDGGSGEDYVSYFLSDIGVSVSLALTGEQATGRSFDTLRNIERLQGSLFGDVLTGSAGDDIVFGEEGDDILEGGAGADSLHGGDGVDWASYANAASCVTVSLARTDAQDTGGAGLDTLVAIENLIGSAFDDVLTGNAFSNRLHGGAGTDTVRYSGLRSAYEVTTGADGVSVRDANGVTDTLVGIERIEFSDLTLTLAPTTDGDDTLLSTAGDDILDGGAGTDTASYANAVSGVTVSLATTAAQATGHGSDTLISIENLIGSAHNDILTGNAGANLLNGGAGVDTASYASAASGVTVSLQATGAQATGGAGGDTLIGIENLTGSEHDDTLTAAIGGSILIGLGGRDTLNGAAGADTLDGGDGDDLINGGAGNDTLRGGAGNDTVTYAGAAVGTAGRGVTVSLAAAGAQDTGTAGSDTLSGFENLLGSDFNDTLTGDDGANLIMGGAGDDVLNGGVGADHLHGGRGGDRYYVDNALDLIFENAGEGIDEVISTVSTYLYANVENLQLAAGAGAIYGVGNELNNIITGNESANLLIGGAGADRLDGGGGGDSLWGQDDADTLFGGGGADLLAGGGGDDVIHGEDGDDQLFGEDGDDVLLGGEGRDILVGGAGNDVLHGTSSSGEQDLMDGGAGDDTYRVDTATDLTFEAVNGGIDTVISFGEGSYYLYANVENLRLDGATINGVGNELDNVITGSILGNWLLGGAGNDTLNGKNGNDVLFGQAGADTFVFERGTKGDVIGDFQRGADTINLVGIGYTWQDVRNSLHQNGDHTAIDLGQGDFIVVHNVAMSAFTADDFIL